MKNILFLLISVLLLSGCGPEKEKTSEKDTTKKEEVMKKAMEVPINTPSEEF